MFFYLSSRARLAGEVFQPGIQLRLGVAYGTDDFKIFEFAVFFVVIFHACLIKPTHQALPEQALGHRLFLFGKIAVILSKNSMKGIYFIDDIAFQSKMGICLRGGENIKDIQFFMP